ncbi:MAG: response regulator [Candidatus Bathyarchaeia archaeon]|jgi:DNA-binding NtrC family response regulator
MKCRKARILVIDDDEGIRRVLSTVLEDAGHLVDTAKDGEDAIQRSATTTYDLALIDIRLPDMDGTKLLTMMKDSSPRTVKIIVTGYPTLQNAVQAVKKGADGYITKPVDMERLLETISYHLRQSKAQKPAVWSHRPRKNGRGKKS